jgi:hypothetical protein
VFSSIEYCRATSTKSVRPSVAADSAFSASALVRHATRATEMEVKRALFCL